ncbi:MAG: TIR domain-containing protein, partial [Lachnospiraceae bacterium]|nr:TIR domain-containing protein [Lachnospiraceae bacterium]
MRYDAFISYRHSELDMEIAKKVHTGLETYKIPKSVQKKTGKKKMGRVFRDQEELPIGSDLDDNISTALQNSEYLIVICSPRTPESYWVCKEIESFIQMHDRNHILAVLIEGEPDESFPPQLLTDDEGNPVEPLAADVRGADRKERNAKFKTEILRLAAPVIGCTYDDLKQRHRERIIKRTIAIVSSVAAVVAIAGTAFGIYNANVARRMTQLANEKAALADEKTKLAEEITVQYQGKQENQSRFYAEEALTLLRSGNREDAVLVAMKGLPSEGNDRPYVADAEYALARALYAYDEGSSISYDRVLTHDLSVYNMYATEDRKKVITTDAGSKVYVWNTNDWSLALSIDPAIDDTNYYVKVESADADDTGVYVATENELIKYDYSGKVVYNKKYDDMIEECEVCDDTGRVVIACKETLYVLDTKSGKVIDEFENTTGYPYTDCGKYYKDRKLFVTSHYSSEATKEYITMYDLNDGSIKDVQISEGYYLDSTLTENGNIAVLSCNNDMLNAGLNNVVVDLVSPEGNILWTRPLDVHVKYMMTFNSLIRAHSYTDNEVDYDDIVVTCEAEAFTLDEKTGALVTSFTLPGDANALAMYATNSFGRVGYRQGDIDFVDFREGRIYSEFTFKTEESIREWIITEDGTMIYSSPSSPDVYIVSWHEAPDIEDYNTFEYEFTPKATSPDGNYYIIAPKDDYQTLSFRGTDAKEIYKFEGEDFIKYIQACNDKAYVTDKTGLWVIDPYNKKKELIKLADYGFDNFTYETYITPDGNKAVFYSLREVLVFDIEKREAVCNLNADGGPIGKIIMSGDAGKI